jgi:OmpA-OmpF porin, OOP family
MRILFIFLCLLITYTIDAQIINPKEVAKRKAQDRTNNAIDRTLDKGLDKVEEGIGNIFKKKEKTDKGEKTNSKTSSKKENTESAESEDNDAEQETASKPSSTSTSGSQSTSKTTTEQPKTNLKAFSKFDFVAGEKVLGFEDFNETSVGDFPLGWNTNASGEIVTIGDSPQKWLFMSQDGFFQPDFVKDMPENFTLEFDIFTHYRSSNIVAYNFYIYATNNPKRDFPESYVTDALFFFNWLACDAQANYEVYEKGEVINKNENLVVNNLDCQNANAEPSKVRFSIWRQKNRLRIYVDENKIVDIPQAFIPNVKYNAFKLGSKYMNFSEAENKDEFMISNIRYAVGAPDTRNKLLTEGKLVTRGILFDVNSDKIKPESYGVLKEIGTVLKENPTVKVKIIGHTDADGDDAKNLDLSKRRAASVKHTLSTEFGIEATRMETDGKGETQPSDPNTTPQGKANNRRVEFVKL